MFYMDSTNPPRLGTQGLGVIMEAAQYAGSSYEFDDVDSRADLSKQVARDAVANRVLRTLRPPVGLPSDSVDAILAWAKGNHETLPPQAISAYCAVRFPNERFETNGVRADRATKF